MNRNKCNYSPLKNQVNITMRNSTLRDSTSLAEECQYVAVNTQGSDKLFLTHFHIHKLKLMTFSHFFFKKESARSFIIVNIV